MAFPLLVPEQGIRPGALVGAGGLEGVFLLYCDLSFLLGDGGLPHGTWKKARVSDCAGKGSEMQNKKGCKVSEEKAPRPVRCSKSLMDGKSKAVSVFGQEV